MFRNEYPLFMATNNLRDISNNIELLIRFVASFWDLFNDTRGAVANCTNHMLLVNCRSILSIFTLSHTVKMCLVVLKVAVPIIEYVQIYIPRLSYLNKSESVNVIAVPTAA